MPDRRRLPVVHEPSAEEGPTRPPYQWIGFGAVAMLVLWLPLAWFAARTTLAVSTRWLGAGDDGSGNVPTRGIDDGGRVGFALAALVPQMLALGVAAAGAGFLVGRWGGQAGVKEGAAAAAVAAAAVLVLSAATGGFAWSSWIALPVAAGAAALGAGAGRKRRS